MRKILVISTLFILTACGQSPEKIVKNVKPREVFTLQLESFSPQINLTGNVEAEKSIPISAKIMGRIDSLFVDVGDEVCKGQILARYSALDNDSLVQYQSALSQFKSTEASAQNAINTAEVQVESGERALAQVKKEEKVQQKKQYDTLYTNSKLTEVTISSALNFLDKNLEASNNFRGMNPYQRVIGSNNAIFKNNLKNEVSTLISEFSQFEKTIPQTESEILNFAELRLSFLKKIKEKLLNFDSLIRETTVSSRFSESAKNGFIQETASYLGNISKDISNLENFVASTIVLNEQLGLKVLSAENALKSIQSNLELAKSNSENQVVAARSQVSIAANYQQEMIVKAPFAGVIISREIDTGQLVSPGQMMFQVADISSFKVQTEVADSFAGMMETEIPVEISVDGLNEKFAGIVTKVNPALDPQTRKLGIEVSFLEDEEAKKDVLKKLKIGLFARMKMEMPEKSVFKIPRNFIKFDYDGAKIKTKDGQILPIEILSEEGNKVEVNFAGISDEFQITQF